MTEEHKACIYIILWLRELCQECKCLSLMNLGSLLNARNDKRPLQKYTARSTLYVSANEIFDYIHEVGEMSNIKPRVLRCF